MAQNKIKAIPVAILDTSTIDNLGWHPINPGGLPEACFLIRLVMTTNAAYFISYDGIDGHDLIVDEYPLVINGETNAQPNNYIANFTKGTVVYVRGAALAGTISLAGYYSPKDRI